MEEIPDEDNPRAGKFLSMNAKALIMTEEEYQSDIQEGGESPLAKQKTMKTAVKTAVGRNPTARNSPKPPSAAIMTAEDTLATKNTTVPDILEQHPNKKKQTNYSSAAGMRKNLRFVETKKQYCKPTSSKIKVEDLTATEQELAQPEKHQIIQASSNMLQTRLGL
jgi:hypothetical protein